MIIGILDSGIGGKTVLKEIKKLLPDEEFVYFADYENCPYGTKSLDELKKIVSSGVEYLLSKGAKIIVLACNTATTQTVNFLRERYPTVPFVGTEPAIKKACSESSDAAKILLLVTEGTARAERTRELIDSNKKPEQKVEVVACPGLAKAIEDGDDAKIEVVLSEIEIAEKFETVVLGCTHYPIIRDKIQRKFPAAKLIDGSEGVAKEVLRVYQEINS
ncbi:glutamate racemase [Candidatus Saccharibacteria bacterium]|nr:glutamate racemase [Candidatus Saccharibacteria bacterium]